MKNIYKLFIAVLILGATAGTVKAATILFPTGGGTGNGTIPTYGQLLVGNAGGTYTLTATSSLGISGGGSPGGASSTVQYNCNGAFCGNTGFTYTGNTVGINLDLNIGRNVQVTNNISATRGFFTELSASDVATLHDLVVTDSAAIPAGNFANFTFSANSITDFAGGFSFIDSADNGIVTDVTFGNTFIGNQINPVSIDSSGNIRAGAQLVGLGCDLIGGDCGQEDVANGLEVAGTFNSGLTYSFGGCDHDGSCPITTEAFGNTQIGSGAGDTGYTLSVGDNGTGNSINTVGSTETGGNGNFLSNVIIGGNTEQGWTGLEMINGDNIHLDTGHVGIDTGYASALLTIGSAGGAVPPLLFSSALLTTSAANGSVEFNSPNLYFTGTASKRQIFILATTSSQLASSSVPYVSNGGGLTYSQLFKFDGSNLGIGTGTPNATVSINGSQSITPTVTTSTSFIVATTSSEIYMDSTSARTAFLPTCNGTTLGLRWLVADSGLNASTNNITITAVSSNTIDGASTKVMNANGQSLTFVCYKTGAYKIIN